jgi:hypothetical protein
MVLWRGAELTDDILVQRLETVRANQGNPWQAMYLLALVHVERGDRGTALSLLRDASQQASVGMEVQEEEVQVFLERTQPIAIAPGNCPRIFWGHKKGVRSVSMSADGRWVLSGGEDKTVRLWEVATGDCLHTFKEHKEGVSSVSMSADGHWVLSGSLDRTVRLWDVATGDCLRTFKGHKGRVTSVYLSADGRWVLSGSGDGVRLWEVATGKCLRTFTLSEYRRRVTSVSLSADGRWILAGSDDGIRLWELEWELEAHDPIDWDEGASPALETFLTLHIPYAGELPLDREPTEQEIQQALTRRGEPSWNERDFQDLIRQLQYSGYGWLRPEGVQRKLEEMAASWQGPPPLTSTP